jgi:hypothetical protein
MLDSSENTTVLLLLQTGVEACAQTGLPGKEMHLPVIWTSYQFPVLLHSCKLRLSQSRVRT